MSKQNVFLGKIKNLPPLSEILEERPLKEKAQIVTVNFEDDRVGLLDLSYPLASVRARMINYLQKNNRSVYVEIDPETNIITKLYVPEAAKVWQIKPQEEVVYVAFHTSSARHFLRRNHPEFQEMLNALQTALDTDSTILVTSTTYYYEIIDVRPLPPSFGIDEPPGPPPPPFSDPPVTWERAVQLFNMMKNESCTPCSSTGSCIPYKYPYNGCWIRAHLMCYLMIDKGETPEKIWIDSSGCNLHVNTSIVPECEINWCWHVAPTLMVEQDSGPDIKMVIDPSLCDEPVTPEEWRLLQTDTSATLTPSPWTKYGHGGGTATQSQADNAMESYRIALDGLCSQYGPPPYACPIVKNSFFIVDRNTFSKYEIEAMLNVTTPAIIEAAFYIVVDGFSPAELNITLATLTDPPNVKPTLVPTQNVPEMSLEAVHLGLQYPSYLNRRQRMTWVYRITFTGTSGFVNLPVEVTLDASISTVSSSAKIYLIEQPNPFEVDGETSWLCTDLRVFQIKAGESKFGVNMGSDPSVFISQVISNLNSGNTGGQTFENDISTDYQASRLELSEKVNGISVYNFTVGKVRYRSMGTPANDVRVFFRLIPYTSTSLQYNQATTYRRGGQAGVVIPLLGIQNGEASSFPCFAALRIDSSTTSMNTQTDPDNVQIIPHNASGAEVVRYYGCWLDINQPSHPQFPIQPLPTDGPFPSSRKTIQELIRNKHQCLVSEIAYDNAPISSGVSPSSSDKLAQRNLSIVESANPGIVASRRIPNTFDFQLSKSKLEPDELMIDWGNTPIGSLATVYLPDVSADDILSLAVEKYRSHSLVRIDDHTLQCQTGGITYIPIPLKYSPSIIGMLTVDLPPTVERGQVFTIIVRQVAGEEMIFRPSALATVEIPSQVKWRQILGSYQITIPVSAKETILEPEERLLSNLRWIERAIPADNRWFKVFSRYVKQTATRVDALGGDSTKVLPSPSGDWKNEYRKCTGLALLTALLLATYIVRIGTLTSGLQTYVDLPISALLASVGYYWIRNCRPQECRLLRTFIGGFGLGALILALLALLGTYTPQLFRILVTSIVMTVAFAVIAWRRNGF